jgi:ABC-2 type transport system permease protein
VLSARLLTLLFGLLFLLLILSTLLALLGRLLYADDAAFFAASPLPPEDYFRLRLWQATLASGWMVLLLWLPYLWALRRTTGFSWAWVAWGLLAPLPLAGLAAGLAALLLGALLKLLPGAWLRRGLFTAAALMGLAALLALRLSRPERLADPTVSRNALAYLAGLDALEPWWWPGTWAGRSVMNAVSDPWGALLWWGLGMTAALAAWHGAVALWGPHAWELWWRGDEGGKREGKAAGTAFSRPRRLPGLLMEREAVTLARAPGQALQALMLGTLVILFLLSLSRLPIDDDRDLKAILYLPVLGLSQVILLAVTARFAFPAGSLEQPGSWLLRHAPVMPRDWILARVTVFSGLLLALSVPLGIAVVHALTPTGPALWLGLAQLALASVTLATIGSCLGSAWARPGARNAEEALASSAGVLAMVIGSMVLLLQHLLLAVPLREAGMRAMLPQYKLHKAAIAAALLMWLASHGVAVWLSLRTALRGMEEQG